MSILTDRQIINLQHARHILDPFDPARVEPASYDLILGDEYLVFDTVHDTAFVDATTGETFGVKTRKLTGRDRFTLRPGAFVLGTTLDHVAMPHDLLARLEGKSTLARFGLAVHVTAGFIDPGFHGRITLELKNEAAYAIQLRAGMRIGQLVFERLDRPVDRPYGVDNGNHYQHQTGVQGPIIHGKDQQ